MSRLMINRTRMFPACRSFFSASPRLEPRISTAPVEAPEPEMDFRNLKSAEQSLVGVSSQIVSALEPMVTTEKFEKFTEVASRRVPNVRLLFEDIANPFNFSACLRSADSFGIQNVHLISSGAVPVTPPQGDPMDYDYPFEDTPVASSTSLPNAHSNLSKKQWSLSKRKAKKASAGSSEWLALHRHHSVASCMQFLQANKIAVLTADLSPHAKPIQDINFKQYDRFAIVLGNERYGVSEDLQRVSQEIFHIPLSGFSQSLNLSVSCALILQHLRTVGALENRFDTEQQNLIIARWLFRHVKYETAMYLLERAGIFLNDSQLSFLKHSFINLQ